MAIVELRLAEIMKERGLTQMQLSEMADVRQAAISSMVRNHTERLSLIHLAKIMQALEITEVGTILTYVSE